MADPEGLIVVVEPNIEYREAMGNVLRGITSSTVLTAKSHVGAADIFYDHRQDPLDVVITADHPSWQDTVKRAFGHREIGTVAVFAENVWLKRTVENKGALFVPRVPLEDVTPGFLADVLDITLPPATE